MSCSTVINLQDTSKDSSISPPSLPARPAIRELSNLLGTTWRITLKDDERVFTGKFLMLDRRKNIILDETVEEVNGRTRNIGLVMMPGERLLTAEMDRDSVLM